jgi:uncharacterized protein (DUF58 family)
MTAAASSLVSAADLARLHSLEVAARIVVEGVRTGAHRSPHKGHSVDFADHRAYVPGDDLRHLDWKVMGRSDRLVLKRYEAETDLGCHLCVDGSASMGYQGSRAAVTKYRYAATLAACLGCLVLEQRDRAGLVLFHETAVVEQAPALQGQLIRMCRALEAHTPAQGTDAAKGLQRLHAPTTRKGLVILISDLMDEVEAIAAAVERLAHHGHDCALVWVLDPDERDLGVGSVSRFQGLENDGELTAEPRALRTAYQAEVERHQRDLTTMCRRRKLAFTACTTDEAPHLPLNRLLVALHAERR